MKAPSMAPGGARLRNARGITLVEVLVGLTILAVVTTLLAGLINSTSHTHGRTLQRAEVQSGTREALSLMTTELRQAGADPSNPPVGITAIIAADANTVHIRSDLNGNGSIQTTEPSEDVTYTYDSATRRLLRDPGTGATAVMNNVTSAQFTYFDAANQPLTTLPLSSSDRALVHSIGLTLTCEMRDSRPFTLSTRVTLRNQ